MSPYPDSSPGLHKLSVEMELMYSQYVMPSEHLLDVARAMAEAAVAYLAALTPHQRELSLFPFEETHRTLWEFEPLGAGNPRYGVPWPDLTSHQQQLLRELLRTGLGDQGLVKAETIREVETIQHPDQGTRSYSVWFYGAPSLERPWTWRFEGHHLSATFTICGGEISNTPLFVGVSPTCVHDNTDNPDVPVGTRAMPVEEDTSRALWESLDEAQRELCSIPLPDMMMRTPHVDRVERLPPQGIRVDALRPEQREWVHRLMRTFMGNVAPPLATRRYEEWVSAGQDELWLSAARANIRSEPWGHARPDGYYYRLQGPTFLIEFDDVQWGWQDTGHIHSMWRDYEDDFGFRLLRSYNTRMR
ncbi:DUF3500 domain-containing protein [Corallococcus carmarthensis]|uniref:DUF3500 domain-containing protein n=2 Tax=Corallococcus carmarthensis TaxID=2316728 RepID=A0A3A8K563_9BACT|nr:DUF3500 domain-containing protein [Corallococcus carmarthensis]RKG99474.1 DUF3500 domain-containing protein [Corallococcus carmarthensis]